ncbi:ABC transporter ATP-binding protein [Ktedonosporobacter rubrisoli]
MRDMTKSYLMGETRVTALHGVSLLVQRNEFVTIIGPSGSGKSTLMNLIGCLDRPSSGEYILAGQPIAHLNRSQLAQIRNRHIGFVFQGFNLLPRATALDNVALPLIYAGIRRSERERRALEMLKLVGLGARIHHKPTELSGGQQQRIAIARALVTQPSLLLADEPTGALDSRTSAEIMEMFHLLHQAGLTIVLVTHDPGIAAAALRQVVLRDGRIIYDGPKAPASILSTASDPLSSTREGGA